MPQLSTIIPVRNDAAALGRTLDYLSGLEGMAATGGIVAASGDPDRTERAVAGRARLLWPAGSTRAILMKAGAAQARGEVLCFLPADSFPPARGFQRIEQALADDGVVGGAFEHLFTAPLWSLRVITWINRMRYRLTHNYYGDQGIFVRGAVFQELGGYQDLRIMEELDVSQRLKRAGRTVVIPVPLRTSGRRFLTRGPWRTFFFIVWLLLLHTLRFDTQPYAGRWRGPANRPPGSPWPRGYQRPMLRRSGDGGC